MAPGGYFGRALVVDAGNATASVLPLGEEVLRGYLGGYSPRRWAVASGDPRARDQTG